MSYIREQGAALARLGYPIIPIVPGKKACLLAGWQNMALSPEQCETYDPTFGVGIVCGSGRFPVVGIDADVEGNEKLANIVYSRWCNVFPFLRNSFKRVGKHPKFLLLATTEKPVSYDGSGEFVKPGFPKVELEILGKGHQFVAYHTHPDTKQPYVWSGPEGKEPTEVPPSDLIPISIEQLNTLKQIFLEEVQKDGYSRKTKGTAGLQYLDPEEAWTFEEPDIPPLSINATKVREIIEDLYAEGKIDCNTREGEFNWRDVGMRLHHQFNGLPEGLDIWDEFSRNAGPDKYKGYEDVAKTYSSFGKNSGRKVTFAPLYKLWMSLEKNQQLSLNEMGLMYRVNNYAEGRLRYVREQQVFREYVNGRWENITESRIRRLVMSVVERKLPVEANEAKEKDFPRYQQINKFKAKVEASLNHYGSSIYSDLKGFVDCSEKDFDRADGRFAVGNGVIYLDSRRFEPAKPEQMVTKGSSVIYDPTARSALWEKSVNEIFLGDKEVMQYFQKVIGYAMAGDPDQGKSFFLVGDGANGKSLLMNVIAKVFGTYYTPFEGSYLTQKDKQHSSAANAADPTLVDLIGSRLALCMETESGASLKSEMLKRLVSNDVQTGRAMYQGTKLRVIPTWVIFVATNFFPETLNTDAGTWRRISKINFNAKFDINDPKTDTHLEAKLSKPEELSGILNWCLDGYDMFKKEEKLIEPDAVIASTRELREEFDVLTPWIEGSLVVGNEKDSVAGRDLYQSWQEYRRPKGIQAFMTETSFGREISKRFKKVKGQSVKYVGVRLKTDYEIDFDKEIQAYL